MDQKVLPNQVGARSVDIVQHRSSAFTAGHKFTDSIAVSVYFLTSDAGADHVLVTSSED